MVNIFEEAFKANSQLSKRQLKEAAGKPKIDLTKVNPKSMASILEAHKDEINKATSVKELYNTIVKLFKDAGLDTKATKRLLTTIASKKDLGDAQTAVYNSILAGSGLSVEGKDCKGCKDCEKADESCDDSKSTRKAPRRKRPVKEDVENYQPDEDILVVYNTDLEKNMSEEEIAQATEDMVGKCVCKCGVCGANYLYDITDESVSEDDVLEVDAEEFTEEPVEESFKKNSKKHQTLDESLLFKGLSLLEADDEETDVEDADVEETETEVTDETDSDETIELDAGSNEESEEEDKDFEAIDSECPICGAKENQIVIGRIEKEDEVEFDLTDEEDANSDWYERDSLASDYSDDDKDSDKDINININVDTDDKDEVEEGLFSKKKKAKDSKSVDLSNFGESDFKKMLPQIARAYDAKFRRKNGGTGLKEMSREPKFDRVTSDGTILFTIGKVENVEYDPKTGDISRWADNTSPYYDKELHGYIDESVEESLFNKEPIRILITPKDNVNIKDVIKQLRTLEPFELVSWHRDEADRFSGAINDIKKFDKAVDKLGDDVLFTYTADTYTTDKSPLKKRNKEESLDSIDADRDDKVRRAINQFKKARDDADADRDYKLNRAGIREGRKKNGSGSKDTKKKSYATREDPNPDPKFVIKSNIDGEICKVSTESEAKKTISSMKRDDKKDETRKGKTIEYSYEPISKKKNESYEYSINEKSLSKLFTTFARENYENVSNVEFTNGNILKNGEIRLEGVVNTRSHKVRHITIESIGFKSSINRGIIKFTEKGPFTESAKKSNSKVPFVVECRLIKNRLVVGALKYNYVVTESNKSYSVSGRHSLSE